MSRNSKIVVIVGPNASGKSGLAIALAKKFVGEVISADSRQVYKGFDLSAGKITKREMRGVRHHLLDIASPRHTFTAAQFQKLGRKTVQDILKRNKLPIVCGGTGFYVRALIDGIALPAVKPNYKLRRILSKKTATALFKMLKRWDPARAQNIDAENPRRLIRALEIVAALGGVPSQKTDPLQAEILMLGLAKDKNTLKKSIRRRLEKRLNQGMLKEIKNLRAHGLSWQRLENFGLEYRYGALFLQGKISESRFKEYLEKAIWQYAKRQLTWFKKDKRIKWIKNQREATKLTRLFLK